MLTQKTHYFTKMSKSIHLNWWYSSVAEHSGKTEFHFPALQRKQTPRLNSFEYLQSRTILVMVPVAVIKTLWPKATCSSSSSESEQADAEVMEECCLLDCSASLAQSAFL